MASDIMALFQARGRRNQVKGGSDRVYIRKATLRQKSLEDLCLHFIVQNRATLTAKKAGKQQLFKLDTFPPPI